MQSSQLKKQGKSTLFTASEIGQYHFCPISWFLQKHGFTPASHLLQKGKTTHQHLESIVKKVDRKKQHTKIILLVTLFFFFLGILLYFIEVMF